MRWHTGALENEAGGGLAQRLPTLRSHLPSAVSPHQGSNCHQGLFPLSLLSYSSEYDGLETGRKFQEKVTSACFPRSVIESSGDRSQEPERLRLKGDLVIP